jgi:hypothetical protein
VRPSDPGYYTAGRVAALEWPAQDPLPEVTSRDPLPADAPAIPRPVSSLLSATVGAGWDARVAYSRGQARTRSRGVYKRVETWGLWTRPHPSQGWRICAMYERSPDLKAGWGWDRTAIWLPSRVPVAPGLGSRFTDATVTDLKEFIQAHGSVPPAWFKAIHARVQEQQEQQKARARERPATTKHKEGAA